VPEDAYDDPDEMAKWVRLAFDAGLRAEAGKAAPKKTKVGKK
jgi:DNA transformation protein